MLPLLLPLLAKRTHETLRSVREFTSTCVCVLPLGSPLELAIEVGLRPMPVTVPTSVRAFAAGAGGEAPLA